MYIRRTTSLLLKNCAYKAGSVTGNDRNRPAEHGAATVAVLVMFTKPVSLG